MAVTALRLVCLWETDGCKHTSETVKVTTDERNPADWQMSDKWDIQHKWVFGMLHSFCMPVVLLAHMDKSYNVYVYVVVFDCVHSRALHNLQCVPVCVRVCLVYMQRKAACGLTKTNSRVCSPPVNVYQHMTSSLPLSCRRLAAGQSALCMLRH